MLACGLPPSSTCECSEQIFLPPSPAMAWDLRDPCNVQAKTLLLKASPFRTLEALLSLFDDLNGGTGVMYVRAQRQRLKGDLVPHVVDGCKDIRDQDSGATLREYLGHTYLFHKAFKCVPHAKDLSISCILIASSLILLSKQWQHAEW